MKGLTLEKIAQVCSGRYIGEEGKKAQEVRCVVTDSRKMEPGGLFLAVRGEKVDGHQFIPQVFAAGAAAVVSEQEQCGAAGPYILVESSLQALKDIAKAYRQMLHIPVIGITGSVGKTSTKEMIASVLEQKYCVCKTEGNFNNEIGMPLTLLRIRPEHEAAVIEMGISEFGEMHRLADVARPDICVLTNIGQAHLENLKTRDGILQAKSEIFDFLTEDAAVILNGNDDKLATIEYANGVKPQRYYVDDGSFAKPSGTAYAVCAENINSKGLAGTDFDLVFADETCKASAVIPGIHSVYNACAAAVVGLRLGLTHAQIVQGIAAARTIAGRTNIIHLKDGMLMIDDCYNANPDSMRAALDILAAADGRKIAVLGDMGELGEDELRLHRQVGEYAVEKGIDRILCSGPASTQTAHAAGERAKHYDFKEELIEDLIAQLRPGDTVLVKASHFMAFPEIVAAVRKQFA